MLSVASRVWLVLGGLLAATGVAAGAYGRHGALDSFGREMFAIGVDYQLWHALALLGIAWLNSSVTGTSWWLTQVAGAAFVFGVILFSGILYTLGMTGLVLVEGAAPLGGFLMIGGWLVLGLAALLARPGKV